MSNLLNYLIYGLIWLMGLLPLWILYRLADFNSFILNHIIRYRRTAILVNLRNSFPEKSEEEIQDLRKKFIRHLSDLIVETIRMLHMGKKEIMRRFVYKNMEVADELYRQKRSFIIASAHYNNWEWSHIFPAISPLGSIVVYMPMQNKFLNEKFNQVRMRYGGTLATLDETFRRIIEFKKQEKIFIVGLIADQSPPPEANFWTTFLNQETAFYPGTEKIAVRLDLPVVYLHINKVKRGYYEAVFEMLVDKPLNTKPGEILSVFAECLEKEIREKPEFWLWSHKRWKHKKKRQ